MLPQPPPLPDGLDLLTEGSDVTIRRRWFTHLVWFLLFFCIAWDSFLIFWYTMAFSTGAKGPGLIMIIFPVAHVAVGVGLTYFVLSTFLNKTDVTLRPESLTVRTYPLPWRGNRTIPASELASFSWRARRSGRNGSSTYDVMFVNTENREKLLLSTNQNGDHAEYIALALNRYYFPNQQAASTADWGSA